MPHARAEDEVLYPVVDEILGATGATATMSRDHLEIARLVDQLQDLRQALHDAPDTPAINRDVRATLYGLHALVSLHFAKEEEIYLPLLDTTLSPAAAEDMFRRMNEVAVSAI